MSVVVDLDLSLRRRGERSADTAAVVAALSCVALPSSLLTLRCCCHPAPALTHAAYCCIHDCSGSIRDGGKSARGV
jgi:hypothetical protein